MKKLITTVILIILLPLLTTAQTNYEDVVYLKNGSIIHGMIIETVPNKTVKIQTIDGNIFVYTMDEIDKITKEPIKPREKTVTVPMIVVKKDTIYYKPRPEMFLNIGLGFPFGVFAETYADVGYNVNLSADIPLHNSVFGFSFSGGMWRNTRYGETPYSGEYLVGGCFLSTQIHRISLSFSAMGGIDFIREPITVFDNYGIYDSTLSSISFSVNCELRFKYSVNRHLVMQMQLGFIYSNVDMNIKNTPNYYYQTTSALSILLLTPNVGIGYRF